MYPYFSLVIPQINQFFSLKCKEDIGIPKGVFFVVFFFLPKRKKKKKKKGNCSNTIPKFSTKNRLVSLKGASAFWKSPFANILLKIHHSFPIKYGLLKTCVIARSNPRRLFSFHASCNAGHYQSSMTSRNDPRT